MVPCCESCKQSLFWLLWVNTWRSPNTAILSIMTWFDAGAAELTGAHLTNKTNFYGKKLNSYEQLIKVVGARASSAPWFRRLWFDVIVDKVHYRDLKSILHGFMIKNVWKSILKSEINLWNQNKHKIIWFWNLVRNWLSQVSDPLIIPLL